MPLGKWELWPWNWRDVHKAQISSEVRSLFERYGETLIAAIVAGVITPHTEELRNFFEDAATYAANRSLATEWLTECRDSHERREDRLEAIEVGVFILITLELVLSLYFGFRAINEGNKQAAILDQMNTNTRNTALQIQKAATSLDNLVKAQPESLDRLSQMNDKLQASLTTTGTMAAATRKQLNILQQEQAERTAQLAKKPKLQLYIGRAPLMPGPNFSNPLTHPAAQQTDTSITFDSALMNEGSAPATRLLLRVILFATDVSFSANTNVTRPNERPDNPFQTAFINIDLIRPRAILPITMTFSFPKGRAPFQVLFNADADEIETATPLGILTVTPTDTSTTEHPHPHPREN